MSVSNDFYEYGGSYLISEANADKFIYNGQEQIGRSDGQFMIPSNQTDELISSHQDNPRAWEKQLGLGEGSLGYNPSRVDVYHPDLYDIRESTPDLSGSNDKYVPDGKTAGGYDEAVCSPFPNPASADNNDVGQISSVVQNHDVAKEHTSIDPSMPPDRRNAWSDFANYSSKDTRALPSSPSKDIDTSCLYSSSKTTTSSSSLSSGVDTSCLSSPSSASDGSTKAIDSGINSSVLSGGMS